jgi:hypothetical protein
MELLLFYNMNVEDLKLEIDSQITTTTVVDSITPEILGALLTNLADLRYKTEFTLIGDIDGINDTFLTEDKFLQGSIKVYVNGLRLTRGDHYYEYGNYGILLAVAPSRGMKIVVDYIPVSTLIETDINVFTEQFSDVFGTI